MASQDKRGVPEIEITRHQHGLSVRINDPNPMTRYLPRDPREIAKAIKNAKTEPLQHR